LLCVPYWTPDDGQKTSPKHVEFYSKNKFEKLVHLVGFIIRMSFCMAYTFCCVYSARLLMKDRKLLRNM